MKNIAVIDVNGIVVAINVHLDDYEAQPYEVEVTEESGPAFVGGDYVDGYLYEPQPFPSWVRLNGTWIAPVAKPSEGAFFWDESSQTWVSVEE